MRKPRQKVRQRSTEWLERDVPARGEVKFWRNFRLSRAEGLFPAIAAGVKREHAQESLKDSSNGGQCLSPFIRGVRVLCKPRLILNDPMCVTLIYFRFELGKLLCTISVVTLLVWCAHSLCYINFYFQETMTFPTLGLSCFVYLLLVEEMELMNFPAVFR